MRKFIASITALALFLGLCACTETQSGAPETEPSQGPIWQEQYDLGVRYLSEGNYQEAILAFTIAIEIDPKRVPAYVGRGDAHVKSGVTQENLTAATADYEKAIELDEASAEAYLGLADLYCLEGNYEKAIEILGRGLEIIGDDPRIADSLERAEKACFANAEATKDYSAFYREEDIMTPKDWRVNGKPIFECELDDFQAEFPCEAESTLFRETGWVYRPGGIDGYKPSNLIVQKTESDSPSVLQIHLLGNSNYYSYFFQPDLKGIHLGEPFDEVLKKLGLTELGIQYCRTGKKQSPITINRSFAIYVLGGTETDNAIEFLFIENNIRSVIVFGFHEGKLCKIDGTFNYNWPRQVLF